LSVGSLLRSSYLLYFSQPAADRSLYQALRGRPVRSIVELGIDLSSRTPRLLEVASWKRGNQPLRYTGIDLFEARPSGQPGLLLKQAFTQLRRPGINTQLVPGDPASALQRVANSLTSTDLLVIAADQNRESLSRAWTWMPRMLNDKSLVFWEEPVQERGQTRWRPLKLADIQRLATEAARSGRRAA
jgi:hypothetical protein